MNKGVVAHMRIRWIGMLLIAVFAIYASGAASSDPPRMIKTLHEFHTAELPHATPIDRPSRSSDLGLPMPSPRQTSEAVLVSSVRISFPPPYPLAHRTQLVSHLVYTQTTSSEF